MFWQYGVCIAFGFMHLHITQLKMLNVVVSLKICSKIWANKSKKKIDSNNLAVVENLKSRKTRDAFLATCAGNIWLITSLFNIDIIVIHVPGPINRVADFSGGLSLLIQNIDLGNYCLISAGQILI